MNTIPAQAIHTRLDQISYDEVTFHPHSFGDPAGRLFWWRGELYRGIRSEWAPILRQLFRDGIIQRLVDGGLLIETLPTSLKIDDYEMVVSHRHVPFASYPEEWCPAMLKDAALTKIQLLTELARYRFTLKDAHPWNILFDAWKPVYVDISSIVSLSDNTAWHGYDEFCRFYLYPLMLMAHGQDRIARRLLPELDGVSKADVSKLTRSALGFDSIFKPISYSPSVLNQSLLRSWRKLLVHTRRALVPKESRRQETYLTSLEQLNSEVEKISLPSVNREGSVHEGNPIPPPLLQDDWTEKQRSLHKLFNELRPASVLTIGGDMTWYCKQAAAFGSRVVSFDTNLVRVTQLYYDARNKKLPILPLVMDFTDPTPSRGLSSHWAIAATERFPCDMVLALGLVHQIVFKRCLNFEQIGQGFALFSKRWLVVEFVPGEDPELRQGGSDRFSWYTLDRFMQSLRKWFRSITILPSHSQLRVLLLCEK
jgi:hypothetical protein